MEKQLKEQQETQDIRSVVRQHYGKAAAGFQPQQSSCCGGGQAQKAHLQSLYETPDAFELPPEVSGLSMGCGDPITLASLQPGQTVLDLGSGGGIDCFLAAKKVGESGRVIGVDMTAEMIEKARANQQRMNFPNVEFRLGEIEHLPVADNSVDVVISNCVINLSPDKPQVLREAYRTLKPGGRLAVSDIVTEGELPQEVRESLEAWAGCIAGALDVSDFARMLEEAGFEQVSITHKNADEGTLQSSASSCCSEDQGCCSSTGGQVSQTVKPAAAIQPSASSCCSESQGCCSSTSGQVSQTAEPAGSTETSKGGIFSARISAVKPAA